MSRVISGVLALLCLIFGNLSLASGAARPNVLVIMADDLGFSDVGCYGSEIDTPHLDRLAANGLRFSQFYNTAKCHSSRISLLTGRYAYQAGQSQLTRAVTTAEVLQSAGYWSAMVGKWHLDQQPTDFGFERYFGHLSGACNYFQGDNTFRLNGQPWKVPADGFYTTVAKVDYALKFLSEARQTGKPWYLYVAFNAPHAPLQPLEADYKKYLGRYDVGWDAIREARVRKQAELGLFGKAVEASPRPSHVPAWNTLSAARKKWESRRMAAYAGLIDRVDQELGRLIVDIEHTGELENTFILFVSDNGACPYDRRNVGMDREPYQPDTRWSDSTGWAWARNAPFRFYKQNQFEGGVATPGIVHWPTGLKTKPGAIVHDPVHLVDVLPTVAELAGATLPAEWPDRELEPVAGVSFAPVLAGQRLGARPPIHLLFAKDRGLRDGDWKLASFQSQPWELYNLAIDRTELHDVAAQYPEVRNRLVRVWHEMADKVLHAPARVRGPVLEIADPVHREWTNFGKEPGESDRKARTKRKSVRARENTKLALENDQLVLATGVTVAAAETKPNVLLIICDDLNTHLSTSGYPHIKTPAFDQLAAAGMTFGRAYCQYPVCGPSRASFLSGLYPQSTGILDNKSDIRQVRPGTVSMPQSFKEAGYWTGSVGKVFHNAQIDPGDGAWNEVFRFENDEMPMVTPIRKTFEAEHGPITQGKARRLWREFYPTIAPQTRGQHPGYGPSGLRDEQHKDGKNARQIARWLEDEVHGDQPFFMACGIQKPHVPFLAPDAYFELYRKEDLTFAPASLDFWDQAPKMAMTKRYEGFGFEFGVENDALRREYIQAYHACISFIDVQIGLLFDALKRTGHWDDTIIVLTSDHGYLLGEYFMWGKVMLFEACDRVPLVIRVPGQTIPGSSTQGLVELIDLFPTLADLCKVPAPDHLQGHSLVRTLHDPTTAGKEVAYTVVSRGDKLGRAIRTNRWRYTLWPVGEELYDLQGDPNEQKNLATSEEHFDTIKAMRAQLARVDSMASSER